MEQEKRDGSEPGVGKDGGKMREVGEVEVDEKV